MNMKWLYRLIPILAIITLAIPHAPIQAMSTWADTDYPYRFEVTVESDYVDVDEEFPFVIDDAPAHFWDNVQDDGADILVCAEDKTKLYSELATWSYLFHDIELWVKGELSSTEDATFYVYYGIDIEWADNDYTGITGSTPAQAVWDDSFVFVSHMNDQEGGTKIYDSTSQESGFTVTGDYSVYPCVATNFNYSNLISQQNYASIDLSWDYCADEIEYTVVRSETWYPLDPLDGEVRYSGSLLGFTDTFTPGENTYYYSIFSTTDLGTNTSYSTLLVNMPMTPVEVGGNMMWVIIPIVIAGGIVIFAVRANIHMGQGKIKPDVVMRGIAIGLVALVAILAMLGVL